MSDSRQRIRAALESDDPEAASRLLPLVYDELRRLARQRSRREAPGQSLQATALVHGAYLRLLGPEGAGATGWENRGHFFSAAAEAMRRILVDRARANGTIKRGGGYERVELTVETMLVGESSAQRLDLDEALTRLEAEKPDKAQLVKLRFCAGLTQKQAAAVLGISHSTADRYWTYSRAWLFAAITGETCLTSKQPGGRAAAFSHGASKHRGAHESPPQPGVDLQRQRGGAA